MYTTEQYEGMIAETITIKGANGDEIHTYFARPQGPGPFPAVVVIHHLPGWDETYRDFTRKLAHHGYLAISPDLYCRDAHGVPEDVAAAVRADGGAPDDRVMADVKGAADYVLSLPSSNGKVGVWGTCSGGRHAFLAGCRLNVFDAVVECWGGNVIMGPDQLTDKQPVSPNEYTDDLSTPLLGLFGDLDQNPSPRDVDKLEAALKAEGKAYAFYRNANAQHAFNDTFNPVRYNAEVAADSWPKLLAFFDGVLKTKAVVS